MDKAVRHSDESQNQIAKIQNSKFKSQKYKLKLKSKAKRTFNF